MKKILILLLTIAAFTSCKNESNKDPIETEEGRTEKQNDGLTLVKGEFVYYADAAVLQTKSQIYGVIINGKVSEINKRAKQYKTEDTDFVMVEVRGEITPKPEGVEGWDNRIEIKEILNVSAVTSKGENVVKLGTN
jgi:hypothetical protein